MFTRKKILQIVTAAFVVLPVVALSQTATIDFAKTKQVIDGFGGSSAWEGAYSDALMDAIYKNGDNQLGFTILRNRIDPNKSWADEKSNARKAKARGATVFATPWSPPKAMKTNNDVNNGGEIKSTEWGNYAKYLKEFIDYVGEDLDIISIQNEPDYHPNYESCAWNATQFLNFCRDYAQTLGRPVMMPESMGFNFALSDPTLNDSMAASHISYVGGHLYGTQPKTYTKAINLGKHVWMTEWNDDDYSANGCMVLAKQVLDCMYNQFNAYVYWWMTASGNGVISKAGVPNKYGYVLSMFARWVRPGYYCVEATYNPQTGVYVVAFKGDRNVIVAVNNSTSSKNQTFACSNAAVTSVQKYTASQSKKAVSDGTIAATNNSFTAALDAQSVTTLVFGTVTGTKPLQYMKVSGSIMTNINTTNAYALNGRLIKLSGTGKPFNQAQNIYVVPGNAALVNIGSPEK